ncbi:uncharacterized protein [Halyomorpha halys]|uniref:uncharacterized protein isoform X2 n=1 Tax=Halyomorpha halys TaxID=286706 RepID=UPI0006D4D4F6
MNFPSAMNKQPSCKAKKFDDTIYEKIIQDQASNVLQPAKKFDAALYRLLVYKSPARVTQNMTTLKLFFHFSGKPEVVFTLSGFLKLDWNLLYSMMAAGCAYLIVIIQLNHFI